jgi:hypothetical protein
MNNHTSAAIQKLLYSNTSLCKAPKKIGILNVQYKVGKDNYSKGYNDAINDCNKRAKQILKKMNDAYLKVINGDLNADFDE